MTEQTPKAVVQRGHINELDKVVIYLSKIVNPIIKYAAYIAGTILLMMMVLVFADVAGREIFDKPISGSFEITEYFMAVLTCLALSYCALEKHHIRVDLILQYTSRKQTLWFDIFAYGISFIFFVLVTWQGWFNSMSFFSTKMTSAVLYIPTFPFALVVMIGAALLTLVFLRDFLKSVAEVMK